MTRSVLSGLCGWAVRQDSIERNPVREAGSVKAATRRAPRSLTAAQVRQLRALLPTTSVPLPETYPT